MHIHWKDLAVKQTSHRVFCELGGIVLAPPAWKVRFRVACWADTDLRQHRKIIIRTTDCHGERQRGGVLCCQWWGRNWYCHPWGGHPLHLNTKRTTHMHHGVQVLLGIGLNWLSEIQPRIKVLCTSAGEELGLIFYRKASLSFKGAFPLIPLLWFVTVLL